MCLAVVSVSVSFSPGAVQLSVNAFVSSSLYSANYFTGKNQFVHIDSQSSEELAITSGVPQGSILGPLLFIVYINDLPRCVKHCSVNTYADDTVLYLAGPTVHNLTFYINQDLQCLSLIHI